jgi:hypothetical protein
VAVGEAVRTPLLVPARCSTVTVMLSVQILLVASISGVLTSPDRSAHRRGELPDSTWLHYPAVEPQQGRMMQQQQQQQQQQWGGSVARL